MVEGKTNFNTKGFTLVELIIVITILAILATIAFISFSSFTSEARDAKVKSELSNIRNSIEASSADWVPLMSFVRDDSKRLSNISIWGRDSWITQQEYNAWTINTNLLQWIDSTPHFVWSTTLAGWAFQLKWELSEWNYIIWNYNSRGITAYNWTLDWDKFTITDNRGLWFFKVWDLLDWWSEVVSISSDLSTLTLSWWTLPNWDIRLATWESPSLFWWEVWTVAMCQISDMGSHSGEEVSHNWNECVCHDDWTWNDVTPNSWFCAPPIS